MFKKSSMRLLLALTAVLTAGLVAAQSNLAISPTAPDRYVVQKGDTLWEIAGRFLRDPWRWPEVWQMNKAEIRDPHWIYPGDVVVLDRNAQRLSLQRGTGSGAGAGTVRVAPQVRAEKTAPAIPSIPPNAIEPWLDRPLVIEKGGLDSAPRIVATQEGRYNLGAGARAYVAGLAEAAPGQLLQVYRQGGPLIDPDTRAVLGYEAIYLGTARVKKPGDPTTVEIVGAVQEMGLGDRLLPVAKPEIVNFVPRAPATDVVARVIAIYGDRGDGQGLLSSFSPALALNRTANDVYGYDARREGGTMNVVSINRGARDGIEVGTVLALARDATVKFDRSVGPWYLGKNAPQAVQLPEERYGLLFVFRVFDNVSYGLVMRADRPLVSGDVAMKP
jgi:hypothetical protein